MQDSNLILYVAFESAAVLLAVSIFLFFHISKQKKIIGKLEEKVISLRQAISKSRDEIKTALAKLAAKQKIKPKLFLEYLDEEIEHTIVYHKALKPDRDIVLDITPDAPIERQAVSLRHALLIAEKEARHAGDDSNSSWDVLLAKFQQIIDFYQSMEQDPQVDIATNQENVSEIDPQEIENYQKTIANLERYKKLFFDTEQKWQAAKIEAENYCKQLLSMSRGFDDSGEFESLLKNYSAVYSDIDNIMNAENGGQATAAPASDEVIAAQDRSEGQKVIFNQDEMQRLRNMAVDQHKVITQLKRKLVDAKSPEEQQEIVDQLTQQMDQQQRFLAEAETCSKLIEDELSRVLQENEQLREKMQSESGSVPIDEEKSGELENLVEELTSESKKMLSAISDLEQENRKLKKSAASGEGDSLAVLDLQQKLSQVQQDLLNTQTQRIELEERYLELKMSTN